MDSEDIVTLIVMLVIVLPMVVSIILLIGSREGWFGRGEKSERIDTLMQKIWKPLALFTGSGALINAGLTKETIFYTCRFCQSKSHQNIEFCPQCGKDDYGKIGDKCSSCNKPTYTDYKYCPHCGDAKLK